MIPVVIVVAMTIGSVVTVTTEIFPWVLFSGFEMGVCSRFFFFPSRGNNINKERMGLLIDCHGNP